MASMLLPIGPVTLRLDAEEEGFIRALEEYFIFHKESRTPDITLDLQLKRNEHAGSVPNSLYLTKEEEGGVFYTGNRLIKVIPPAGSEPYVLEIDPRILEGGFIRVFEQILYQAACTAGRVKGIKLHLVHSSSIKKGNHTYMFVGPSGTGKSTVAGLSSAYEVMNDEISVLEEREEDVILYGSPYNGLFRDKVPGSAPLRAIMLLRQAPYHRLTPAGGGEAVKILAREIIPPVGLADRVEKDTFLTMLDTSSGLCGKVPAYHMDFMKDNRFWDEIGKEWED